MLSGIPVIYGIDPFETEASPSHQLGAIGVAEDGRKFRYAQVGASTALVAGNLLQSAAEDTGDQAITPTAAAIGDRSVLTSSTMTVTANQYAEGYMVVSVTPGLGHAYKIKSHPAATAAALTFQLWDAIEIALTTISRVDFVTNPFSRVIQNPASASGVVVGVAMLAAAVDVYTWIASHGVADVLSEGVTVVGAQVRASSGTAGAVIDSNGNNLAAIGQAVTGIASGENGAIFLRLD